MEQPYIDLLYILSCAIHNKKARLRPGMDIASVVRECYGQNCELLALAAVISAEGNQAAENLDEMKSFLIKRKMKEALRTASVGKMLKELEYGGHSPVVIKGPVLADLYPDPLLRESVDTDLFFKDAQERDGAEAFLLEHGGAPKNPDKTGKHSSVIFPGVGTVELHKSLYDDDFQRLHLKNEQIVKQPLERITARNGIQLTTLGKTDTVKYIFCHMIHHFLFSRCDLKQICDILLYIKKYKNEIDVDELYDFLNKTNYTRAFETIVSVGVRYLSFSAEELTPVRYSPETAQRFLLDCFNGCARSVWGKTVVPRGSGIFSVDYYDKKFAEEKGTVRRSAVKRIARGIFPRKKLLTDMYPYCAKRPLLLPAAWANNLFDLAAGVISNRGKLREREPLLKEMGML